MSNKDEACVIWDELLEQITQDTSVADSNKMIGFLKALWPQLINDDSMILSTDNSWAANYIESNYKNLITNHLTSITGSFCEAIIVVSTDGGQGDYQPTSTTINKTFNEVSSDLNTGLFEVNNSTSAVEIGRSQNHINEDKVLHNFHSVVSDAQEQPKNKTTSTNISEKTFDSFIIADTNSMAYGAAYSVAENPGEIANPLFIYGRSGLGKTHLLLAIMNYVNSNYPNKKVYYAPATNLVEDYVNSLNDRDWTNFNKKYRGVDMLLLDDVQYLEGKEETTNEFFKIFNEMITQKKHVVLSSDRAPKDINLDERLKSRFANGVTADIQAPKYETKLKIFQNYIEHLKEINNNKSLQIPNEVIERVVELSNSNIRNLEGAAASLVVYILYGREGKNYTITVEEAEERVTKIFYTNISEKITISDIQRRCEQYFNVSHGEMLGSQRPRHISNARQVAMYLSRNLTQASYPDIGKAFKKDHSSVVHACNNIEKKRQNDRDFANEIERIADLIAASEED